MNRIRTALQHLRRDVRGMTTVEYVIALCLVGAVAVGMWRSFGSNVKGRLSEADALIDKNAEGALIEGSEGG